MATYYVAQSDAGDHSGSSLANAMSVTRHNASTFSGDDIIILNGTLTTQLVVPSSGTSGHPISYVFATGAIFSSPCWSTSGAFTLTNKSYITLDGAAGAGMGGYGGTAALANGIIENTANGTGLANHQESCGVYIQEGKYTTIKNLVVRNIYVRTGTTDVVDGGKGIRFADANGNGMNNLSVYNCIIYNAMCGIGPDYGPGDSNYSFYSNTIYSVNWGVACGGRGSSSTLSNIFVYNNYVYGWDVWNETNTDAWHHNGVFIFGDNSDTVTNPQVYGNVFGTGWGGAYQTAGIYINGNIANPLVYGNLFICDAGEYAGNGMITIDSKIPTTLRIYNNTHIGGGAGEFIHLSGSLNGSALVFDVKNNLGSGGGAGTFLSLINNANVTLASNYNLAYNYSATLGWATSATSASDYKTYVQWQALGYDANSLTSDPILTPSYHLNSNSPARGAGTSEAAYTGRTDLDIGAYPYIQASLAGRPGSSLQLAA